MTKISRLMTAPTGAKDWEHKVDRSDANDRWLALVPNVIANVLHVYEREPGAWCVVVLEPSNPMKGLESTESDIALIPSYSP